MKKILILGGGTVQHVRNHLALCAPAYGSTALALAGYMYEFLPRFKEKYEVKTHLTKMADRLSDLATNEDVGNYIDRAILDPDVKIIFFNVAMCDFKGYVGGGLAASGSHAERLKTSSGNQIMHLTPTDKVIKRIRATRKDIFLVAFKTTTDATEQEQYVAGLNLLKSNSCNLVLANDVVTRRNMIIVPEEARYEVTTDRQRALKALCDMVTERSQLNYTRSFIQPGNPVSWNDERVPENLRKVVDHCIKAGAYKPFRGVTAGHFAVKLTDNSFLTSRRKTDYNKLDDVGLVLVETRDADTVIAYGSKPSVGGQSQRIVFEKNPDLDCIVHFHSPLRNPYDPDVPKRFQQWFECGSHECGANTAKGLDWVKGNELAKVVMLDNHGPNIVFSRFADPDKIIAFIDEHFDLSQKTGGPVSELATQ